ncbi:MAG: hypothetical protein LBK61_06700, partial [Spirochaetaceae bacterium]|nr:hypothetical protein [Spirochaetaceae bacterium]
HPFVKPLPVLAERAAAWQAEHPLTADCPAGGENPQGFHPFFSHPFVKPLPNSDRRSSGMAVRAPPYGGCASPSGAQCRRKGVL